MTIKHVFPAGKYYVGDPCYAVKDENWDNVIKETNCFGLENLENETPWNGLFSYNNEICFANGTKYGDGSYYDNYGHEFGVDAGLIGIMPLEACDGDSMEGGQILDFTANFEVWANDGEFHFGNIIIQTGDDENWKEFEEEDEDDEWEYEDDYWGDEDYYEEDDDSEEDSDLEDNGDWE